MLNDQVLERIFSREENIQDVFGGTVQEAVEKMDAYGLSMTEEDVRDLIRGVCDGIKSDEGEMNEESLDSVIGGCDTCYKAGQKAAKLLKIFNAGKSIIQFFMAL